uniref:AAA+ ATPase domain-containing protein n=1 Tax=Ciona savignyi TaxID=51511 RepID=H2Y999_CIOSA
TALGMYSKEGEYVNFDEPCELVGQVEIWLNRLKDTQRSTVRHQIQESVVAYEEKARDQWLFDYPAQVALTSSQIWWTTEVGIAFEKLEEGFENAMKDYNKKQVNQLNTLIAHLLGDLDPLDRQNIMTICTIDVHNRDVVGKLISEKVMSSQAFTWLSQLRHRWDDDVRNCFANICNAQFLYQYEYLGNTSRLVITPLTDRCYITLTQSLNLTMSGAPAGPAGTGKTETTKDLGRALGILVFVFNCSEQMDYKSIGNIYKGLSQTGAWGCFDEFNRIAIEVLSVVAVQVKMIQDALKAKKDHFMFLGDEITLRPSVGIFITMNPGYAGRTELPENLKALFRPCAMVVPDIAMICENMLVAEGFTDARLLARKFITLYDLCKELCSKQYHYDWGLRAVKSVLVVAGGLRRADKQRPEEQVLMRALRDFNLPKIVTEDVPIFMGLITDLFPTLNVPRIRDEAFEKRIKHTILNNITLIIFVFCRIVQLEELLAVRHSVFVIGNAGAGKSQILKTLHETYKGLGKKAVWNDLNPKAITTDELFGFIHPATREWKDGLFSSTMRDQSNISHNDPKWIVLDGDIDPMWIESLNTVMDDNRMLTLASNERIPLTNSMRLLFEIYHLRSATPATVSRAGILFVNPQDLGWNPPVTSWIDTRSIQSERANLTILFDKYVPTCLEAMRSQFKTITPIPDNTMVQVYMSLPKYRSNIWLNIKRNDQIDFNNPTFRVNIRKKAFIDSPSTFREHMLCYMLECLITSDTVPADSPRELYELYFVFAAVWAFGGATMHDQVSTDQFTLRLTFTALFIKKMFINPQIIASVAHIVAFLCLCVLKIQYRWWVKEFKQIKFPSSGSVFDFCIDSTTRKFVPWNDRIPKFEMDPEVPLQVGHAPFDFIDINSECPYIKYTKNLCYNNGILKILKTKLTLTIHNNIRNTKRSILVHTMETTRIRYFVDLLVEKGRPVMLVGNAGCGKSLLVSDTLRRLTNDHIVASVPFNYYTTSAMLQRLLEKHLEKKAGRNYGPVGNKKLIYFLDDVNMPEVDTYGTVGPHTLIRQHIDYMHWYDRSKLALKDIHNTQYVACMNPTAGSFTINPRMQRHFCVFAINFPSTEALESIYSSILRWHFTGGFAFTPNVSKNVDSVVKAAIHLHHRVSTTFLPTAIKFHYIFNLRDLSNIFQGLLFSSPECLKNQVDVIRMWLHESARVYGDKMVEEKDFLTFEKLLGETTRRIYELYYFQYNLSSYQLIALVLIATPCLSAAEHTRFCFTSYFNFHVNQTSRFTSSKRWLICPSGDRTCSDLDQFQDKLLAKPNVFCHFTEGIGEPKLVYMAVKKWDSLQLTLEEALASHNEVLPVMDLVLFEDAIMHICRINRILESPRGNALLVGVGGSGKQSLSRLAAYISGLDVFQLTLKKGYNMQDLKSDLVNLYTRTGVKCIGTVFLMTDAHVADERFLVLINDHLAMGEISDLFTDEETEDIINGVRNEVRAQGLFDSRENCWKFFLDRVRNQLKIVLCFSPVGSTLRVRARKFPALVNCCCIDWFHGWPHEALVSVSRRFVSEIEKIGPSSEDSIAKFMAFAHESVNIVSQQYKNNERRFNYTTPKSFLEQIDLYKHLVKHTTTELNSKMDRLENGLLKLQNTADQVDDLKAKLAAQEVELKSRSETTEKLLSNVGQQTDKVGSEKEVADEEERKVAIIAAEVAESQRQCEEELAKAEPALLAATNALNTLNRNNLTELKSFAQPPPGVSNVTAAVMCLCSKDGKIPRDRSWKASKVFMGMVSQFLDTLINYDKEHIHENSLKATRQYMEDPDFKPDTVRTKSFAAAGLCAWVVNIVRWSVIFVFKFIFTKSEKLWQLQTLNWNLHETKLKAIRNKVAGLNQDLHELTTQFEEATAEKIKCSNEVAQTAKTITLANRLVKGLQSEEIRWSASVKSLQTKKQTLSGDVLLTAAFVSYLGYFTKPYRVELLNKQWLPFLHRQKFRIPLTHGLDPIDLLVDDATIASWNNENLPSDRMSSENAAVLSYCKRWPSNCGSPHFKCGVKWIKAHYGDDLKIVQMGRKGYLDVIEKSVSEGEKVLIENIGESIDPVLQPLLGRNTIKKGKYIKIGEKEVEYHRDFKYVNRPILYLVVFEFRYLICIALTQCNKMFALRLDINFKYTCFQHPAFLAFHKNSMLILQTKLANPHYKPEMQAQTTLINFTVTRDGLEDQLLANVVSLERPDLEQLKVELTKHQNDFKITLKKLEDNLLSRLSAAEGNFLGDVELVENLEHTKRTSEEIEVKVREAKHNEIKINEAREHYRPVAVRASLLYFILNDLHKINPIYQFSLKVGDDLLLPCHNVQTTKLDAYLAAYFKGTTNNNNLNIFKAFKGVFIRSIELTEKFEAVDERVMSLIDSVTYETFAYTSRGLFEKDKLIFTALVTFQVLQMCGAISSKDLETLLRFPTGQPMTSPVDFLTNQAWGVIKAMSLLDEFLNLDRDIEGSPKRWKKLVDSEAPEKEKLPQEWKNKPIIQQLCILRTLRPDRMTYALRVFIEMQLGGKYVENRAIEIKKTFDESSKSIPIFFVLSPGVDPLKDVEALGSKKLGYSNEEKNFHNVSLGQGQEVVAEEALGVAAHHGHWVVLQNVHLVGRFLVKESVLSRLELTNAETAHPNYRVFISAEPPPTADMHVIPQGILENAIKITNEPPTGMTANLHSALDNFNQDTLEMCAKESEFKSILFSLCYFHSAVAERRKFGPQGWNRSYPFNTGDLTISVNVLYNYLEANPKVPWTDLRYLFGEIMYGGHITDDWDRRLCRTYLEVYMDQEQLDSELFLSPGFPVPPNMDYKGYHRYVDEMLPPESPVLYGLHPNAEVGILTVTSDHLFRTVLEIQPREGSQGGDSNSSMEEMVKSSLDEILEKLPEEFTMAEITAKTQERTPYILVCFQECERMNTLIREIRRSLKELDLGLKGELTISSEMEEIQNALFLDKVPTSWSRISYPSLYSLGLWYADVLVRCRELDTWTHDLILPAVVWLGGLFNPQSFLTAVMQSMARKNEWPLDKMVLSVDVTKKSKEDFSHPPREGAYVHGLFLEGAKWDTQTGFLAEARLKELTAPVPVVFVKAILVDRLETKNVYECPLYRTRERGPTFIWTFNLKSRETRSKWILSGVALLLSV